LCRSPIIIITEKARILQLTGHVAYGETRNAYRILLEKILEVVVTWKTEKEMGKTTLSLECQAMML
jgi:hypothetical protein